MAFGSLLQTPSLLGFVTGRPISSVLIEDRLEIPLEVRSLRRFRAWMRSPSFPETGRIDYIAGNIEVDISPRDFFSHGGPAEAMARCLAEFIRHRKLGYLTIGQTRYVNSAAGLSCEPDLMFVSYESLQSKRLRFVAERKDEPGSCLEVEGAADLIVEILSGSSFKKDTQRLPAAYFAAGVIEFWLIDARDEDKMSFRIHRRGKAGFQRVRPDGEDYQKSKVFGKSFRLTRERDRLGYWEFDLQMR